MKNYKIVMKSASNAALEASEIPDPVGDQVLVRAMYSVVSAGTERAWSMDMNNAHPTFPYYPGYCGAGTVVAVGPEARTCKVGDRVIVNWAGHQLYSIKNDWSVPTQFVNTSGTRGAKFALEQSHIVQIPEGVDTLDASFAHIASFSFNGVRKLHLEIGESCMVAGQGILGVFALQVAGLSGAVPLMVSDFSAERRERALKLGADYALNPADSDYLDQINDITHGEGVRCVVEVTGSAAALQQALQYVAWEGRVSLLGCTRVPDAPIDFYRDVHGRGVQLFGAHTLSRARLESHPYHWTQEDDYRAYLKLVANGKMKTRELISRMLHPSQCTEVFAAMAGESHTPPMGLVFDWRTL